MTTTLPEEDKKKIQLVISEIERSSGENTIVIDLRGTHPFTDYSLITTCNSTRQIRSMAKNLVCSLKKNKYNIHHIEGLESERWVLLDCNDVIVNLFSCEARSFYDLEELYKRASIITPCIFINGESTNG